MDNAQTSSSILFYPVLLLCMCKCWERNIHMYSSQLDCVDGVCINDLFTLSFDYFIVFAFFGSVLCSVSYRVMAFDVN